MDKHDATEQAYKNGYATGVREFAERLSALCEQYGFVDVSDIKSVYKEMIER